MCSAFDLTWSYENSHLIELAEHIYYQAKLLHFCVSNFIPIYIHFVVVAYFHIYEFSLLQHSAAHKAKPSPLHHLLRNQQNLLILIAIRVPTFFVVLVIRLMFIMIFEVM